VTARTEAALRVAMTRLLAGRPHRTDGRLTISNLAREANIGRATANRAAKVLEEFRAAITKQQRRQHGPAALRARVRQLEAELMAQRKLLSEEVRGLRASTHGMAQHIQALTLHAATQARQLAQLRAERKPFGEAVIVPITLAAHSAAPRQDKA
jgi:predicted  nucleic acid-binding Zn-ribbon protein